MIQEHSGPQEMGLFELGNSPLRCRKETQPIEVAPPSPDSKQWSGSFQLQFPPERCPTKKTCDLFPMGSVGKDAGNSLNSHIRMTNQVKHQDSPSMRNTRLQEGQKKIKKTVRKSRNQVCSTMGFLPTRVDIGTQTKNKQKCSTLDQDRQGFSSNECQKSRPTHYNIKSYEEKLKIVKCATVKGTNFAAQRYNVSVNNIHRWRISCTRRPGAGRKISDPLMESQLIRWIQHHIQKYSAIPQRRQIRNKARQLSVTADFQASKGWYQRFLDRNPDFKDLPRLRSTRGLVKFENQHSFSVSVVSVNSSEVYVQPTQTRKNEHNGSSKPRTDTSQVEVKMQSNIVEM